MNETQDKIISEHKNAETAVSSPFTPHVSGADSRVPKTPAPRQSDLAAKRAQNLRDNLARRKQQARARQDNE